MTDRRPNTASDYDRQLAGIADEYLRQLDRGAPVDVEEFCRKFPERAQSIRDVLPVISILSGRLFASNELPYVLGDYRLVRELGRGGMGIVYEAEQISLQRQVALKILPFGAVLDQHQLQRFKNEATAAAALKHPHIVGIYQFGCDRGVYFYAMEFIDGLDAGKLIAWLRKHEGTPFAAPSESGDTQDTRQNLTGNFQVPPDATTRIAADSQRSAIAPPTQEFPPPNAATEVDDTHFARIHAMIRNKRERIAMTVQWAIQAAEGLYYAHEQGILHRDIKPSNLIVDRTGRLSIADFGLACVEGEKSLTATGGVVGTLRYMSPEQASSEPVALDGRSDVYSLGVTLYEMLTLRPLDWDAPGHPSRDTSDIGPIAPRKLEPAIPRDLETIILKAIAHRPIDRYATAKALAEDLTRYANHEPILAKRSGPAKRIARFVRRRKSLAALLSILATLLVLIAAGVLHVRIPPVPLADVATTQADRSAVRQTILAPANWPVARAFSDFVLGAPGAVNGDWHYMYSPHGQRDGRYLHYPIFQKANRAYGATLDWRGSTISASNMHPGTDGRMPIVAWKCPIAGRIILRGFFMDADPGEEARDGGIEWFVDMNSTPEEPGELAHGSIANGGAAQPFNRSFEVQAGDMIYFGVDAGANPLNDSTRYDIQIEYQTITVPDISDRRLLAQSDADFLPNCPKAENGDWRYLHAAHRKRDGDYQPYEMFCEEFQAYAMIPGWQGSTVTAKNMHPGEEGQMPIVAWTSPVSGIVHVYGFVNDQDGREESPDGGIGWFLDMNSTAEDPGELAAGVIENGAPRQDFDLFVEVLEGDTIYLGIDPLANPLNDNTDYELNVELITTKLHKLHRAPEVRPSQADARQAAVER